MTTRSPLPWRVEPAKNSGVTIRSDVDERPVAEMWFAGHDPVANGEFVVRACNAHDDLLHALDEISLCVGYLVSHVQGARATEHIESGPRVIAPTAEDIGKTIKRIGKLANDALAKVDGEQP